MLFKCVFISNFAVVSKSMKLQCKSICNLLDITCNFLQIYKLQNGNGHNMVKMQAR